MKRTFFALLFCCVLFGYNAHAQSSPVPENYVLKSKDDYAKYQDDIVKTVDWLQNASWNDSPENRKPANAFIVNWITGSPDVTVTLGSALIKYTDKNPELLVIYLGNYAKYAIQHKADFNKTQADLAAIKALIDKYNKETTHKKDKGIEKLAQLDQDGKLEDWIRSDLEK